MNKKLFTRASLSSEWEKSQPSKDVAVIGIACHSFSNSLQGGISSAFNNTPSEEMTDEPSTIGEEPTHVAYAAYFMLVVVALLVIAIVGNASEVDL